MLEHGVVGLLGGLALFLFPGAAWAYALGRGLSPAQRIALALVLSFTLAPMAMMALNLLLGVPIRYSTIALLTLGVGLAGVAVVMRRLLLTRIPA